MRDVGGPKRNNLAAIGESSIAHFSLPCRQRVKHACFAVSYLQCFACFAWVLAENPVVADAKLGRDWSAKDGGFNSERSVSVAGSTRGSKLLEETATIDKVHRVAESNELRDANIGPLCGFDAMRIVITTLFACIADH